MVAQTLQKNLLRGADEQIEAILTRGCKSQSVDRFNDAAVIMGKAGLKQESLNSTQRLFPRISAKRRPQSRERN